MSKLTRDELHTLAALEMPQAVSIYLPVHRGHPQNRQDPVRFRNLLDDAEEQLQRHGMRGMEIQELLAPGRGLVEDRGFWESNDNDGLAVLLAAGFSRVYRLPTKPAESADVGRDFHISPLVDALQGDVEFHLLAISTKSVRLFRCTRQDMAPVELPADVPRGSADTQGGREIERSVQQHTSAGFGLGGAQTGTAHGHGDPKDDRKPLLVDYLQVLSRHLAPLLRQAGLPVVLAAVDHLHPVFADAFPKLEVLQPGVSGSPDELTEQEMFQRAKPAVDTFSKRDQRLAAERCRQLVGSERVRDRVKPILAAAREGRIETLFVARDRRVWGTVDPTLGEATIHPSREAGDVDLADLAVTLTLRERGRVYVVAPSDIPDHGSLAAILRW